MRAQQITVNTQPEAHVFERSDEAAIIGEISERLIELAENAGEQRTQRWLLRLACLFQSECPRSAWVYLRLCTGDLSELVASHADHGAKLHRSKQGEHKEHKQALAVIGRHYPELANAIRELTEKTHHEHTEK